MSVLKLIDRCETLCREQERPDLLQRLAATRERWGASDIHLLVVGEFKQGKSMLVNALVGAPVCPVDDDIATSVPLTVRHAEQPEAALLWSAEGGLLDDDLQREVVEISTLAQRLNGPEGGRRGWADDTPGRRLIAAEAGLPRRLLADGLTIVDTPGVGGLGSAHGAATRSVLPTAHAVLLVTDASQELTAPEADFLRQALNHCPHVAVVVTKTDLHPEWRRVVELNAERLRGEGLDLPQIPVSSRLRTLAAGSRDEALNTESGFPELVRHIRGAVLARRDQVARRMVRHDVDRVLEALSGSLESERRVLSSPDQMPAVMAELTEARARAEALKKRSAKWQQTLSDGVADLNSDLEHDLRDRIRTIQAEAEAAIDAGDPGRAWPDFVRWLEDRTAGAVADTFSWAEQNAVWLAAEVAAHFEEADTGRPPEISVADTAGMAERVRPLGHVDPGHLGIGQKALIGMKGSYGGVLMFGILTSLAGMSLINPISLGAGLLLGGKAFRDDAEARLARRRAEAKSMVRRQLDDVVFQTGKILRDRLRAVQRTLRDHFAEVADDLSRSLGQSVAGAQNAARATSQQRDARLAAIARGEEAVGRLRAQVAELGGAEPRAARPAERDRRRPAVGGAPAPGASARSTAATPDQGERVVGSGAER